MPDRNFLLTDQVGTLRAVADTSGAIVKRIDYDSFGNIIADSNPAFSVPFGFAGGLHDRDTGLVRFGYRDYSPELGRFVAKDPIDFAGGDTNLYAYVMSDPVNFIDPFGLDSKNPFLQWLIHQGDVYNASGQPVKVIGSDPSGNGRREWWVAPGTWGSVNQYGIKDVDAVYEGCAVVKIRGRFGTWIRPPEWMRPDSYTSWAGTIYRGFGFNPIVSPDLFGGLLP